MEFKIVTVTVSQTMQLTPLDSLKEPVKTCFQAVDALIIDSLHSRASIINDLGRYIVQGGGKRIRPLLVLLSARACGYQNDAHKDMHKDAHKNGHKNAHITLAAAIEFIHIATLLHDDVVDGASHRHGQKTANHIWGNEAAVLVGDFLYSKAFQMLVSVGNMPIMQVLADTTNIMSEGEALQLLDRHNVEISEGDYLNIIRCKTAKLFESCAQIGAILGKSKIETEQAMAQFGLHLGTAFQLIDDVLDYKAITEKTGKSLGNDLAEGKVTLPLIHLLQNGKPEETRFVRQAIQAGSTEHLLKIQELFEKNGSIEYAKRFAKNEIARAERTLNKIGDSPYKKALRELAQFAIERDH